MDLFGRNKLIDKIPLLRRKRFKERKKYTRDFGKIFWDTIEGKFIVS